MEATLINGVLTVYGSGVMIDFDNYLDRPWRNKIVTDLVIKEGITVIGKGAFASVEGITGVAIPNSVVTIKESAFTGCANLGAVILNNGLENIGEYAFKSTGLVNVVIPDSVLSIGNQAFSTCGSLISADLGKAASIGTGLFYASSKLASVTLPDGLQEIPAAMFRECTALTTVEIPDSVESIGEHAFAYCENLTKIDIPDSVESIGNFAFIYCENLTKIDIPDSVKFVGDGLFSDCYSLVSAALPDGLQEINGTMFLLCTALTTIEIPDSVTSIFWNAFSQCPVHTVIVTGGQGANITSGGIIETYFKNGGSSASSWKLPEQIDTVQVLTLRDISYKHYNPDVNIAGSGGRMLNYADAKYDWASDGWMGLYTISGTLMVTGTSESAEGKCVQIGSYTAVTTAGGAYTIENVPYGTSGDITVLQMEGYIQTVSPAYITSLTGSLTGQDIVYTVAYIVTGKLTVNGGTESNIGVTVSLAGYTADTTTGGAYTITGVPYGTSGSITASITGYTQAAALNITSLASDLT
ncbi:MAG: leucine-rich repeat domain-containing protein, partial [Candidatus Methanoplasma sp.]|nr:leucine-rich repeat domain-containing protein [Candidatus Methanoplasma sp.]